MNKPRKKRITTKNRNMFISVLSKTSNVAEACRASEMSRATAYRLRTQYEKFRESWDVAIEEGVDELEMTLRDRVIKGVDEPVFYRGKVCGFVKRYSDDVGKFLLRGQRSDKYGNKIDIKSTDLTDLVEVMTAANKRVKDMPTEAVNDNDQ